MNTTQKRQGTVPRQKKMPARPDPTPAPAASSEPASAAAETSAPASGGDAAPPSREARRAAALAPLKAGLDRAAQSLRASLKAYEKGLVDIADCQTSKERVDREIKAYLAAIDPRDEAAVGRISVKRAQAELLPIYKEKEEVKQDERGAALVEEMGALAQAILARAHAETQSAVDVIEAAISAWFPSYTLPANQLQSLPERTFIKRAVAAAERAAAARTPEPGPPALRVDRAEVQSGGPFLSLTVNGILAELPQPHPGLLAVDVVVMKGGPPHFAVAARFPGRSAKEIPDGTDDPVIVELARRELFLHQQNRPCAIGPRAVPSLEEALAARWTVQPRRGWLCRQEAAARA